MSLLHIRAVELAEQYRKLEGDLLTVLSEIDTKKVFLEMGYGSLFEYMLRALILPESTAYSIQTVIRKSKEIPALKTAVQSGELSLGKAKRIAPVLTKETADEWLEFAKTASVREIDRQIAATHPEIIVERITPKTATRSELKLGISIEFEAKLKRVQDLLSTQARTSISKEQALESALDLLLEKFSARRKGRVIIGREKNSTLTPGTKQFVRSRDDNQCTHINGSGERCKNQRFLEVHHKKRRAQGGDHHPNNLTTLCSAHHAWVHKKEDGLVTSHVRQ